MRLTNLKCEHDRLIYNGTFNCFIKPFRNGTQLTTVLYTFRKPCNDFWFHFVVSYKFGGTAHYRQWMFNYDENLCTWFDGDGKPGMWFALIVAAMDHFTPNTIHACPYFGVEGVRAVDIEAIVSRILPQVIPTGDYRVCLRYHTTANKTFMTITLTMHIDAFKPLDAMPMG